MGYTPVTPLGGGDLRQGIASTLAHVAPADRPMVQEAFRAALQEGVSGRAEFRVVGDDQRERWIDGAWNVRFGEAGAPERIFITALDITELVAGRNALAVAKAEAERATHAKSQFLAAASHDLRQPVQSLILLLAVMERQVATSPKAQQTLKLMKDSINGLQGLLTGILDISRLEAGVMTPEPALVDLDDLLQRLGAEYQGSAGSRGLELRVASRMSASAFADPNMLERALRNLIENALRYTTRGGIILGLRRRGQRVRIDVIDTGMGIPRQKQDEIFQEFHQLNNPGRDLSHGLGLGLAIVARLAKLLGADVEVASRVDCGSRFSVLLTQAAGSGATELKTRTIDDVPAARILIVEDNESIRFGLVAAVEAWGYLAFGAANGEGALDLLSDASAALDLVICDYRLGSGRNGVETIEAIHARLGKRVPAIILTGDTPQERMAQIASAGLELLHKPVKLEELHRKIASMIIRSASNL